jgi:hypothetical protein
VPNIITPSVSLAQFEGMGHDQSLSNNRIKAAYTHGLPTGEFSKEKGLAKLLLNG